MVVVRSGVGGVGGGGGIGVGVGVGAGAAAAAVAASTALVVAPTVNWWRSTDKVRAVVRTLRNQASTLGAGVRRRCFQTVLCC